MKKYTNYIILAVAVLAIGGGAFGYYLWNKPHKDLTADPADFTMSTVELFEAYNTDETTAHETYGAKVVELTGKVTDKSEAGEGGLTIMLEVPGEMFGINCAFQPEDAASLASVEVGSSITLRGNVDGFMMDVNLSRCVKMD